MSSRTPYQLVGIDGGGTGCRVLIQDTRGETLGEAQAGPANYTTDARAAIRNICAALNEAADGAGLGSNWKDGCIAHAGLAGVMDDKDAQSISAALQIEHITVTDDRATSVAGALREEDGILAAIGTGTIVAFSSERTIRYFGGWGHDLADQASGGWLGHDALRLSLLALDGFMPHSDLTKDLLRRFNDDPLGIVRFAQNAEPGDYAAFAPMVVEAARADDPHATSLMCKGAAFLEGCIQASGAGTNDAICLAGGVGPHYKPYLAAKYQSRIRPPKGSALDGALFLAKQQHTHLEAAT